jgi:hypothetical protein
MHVNCSLNNLFAHTSSVKQHASQGIDSGKGKMHQFKKRWTVNTAINDYDIPRCYYVDLEGQQATMHCLDAI